MKKNPSDFVFFAKLLQVEWLTAVTMDDVGWIVILREGLAVVCRNAERISLDCSFTMRFRVNSQIGIKFKIMTYSLTSIQSRE